MLNTLLPILLFAALGLAVLGALRRVNMWRRGRASKVDLLGGLLAMPKRYMVDLHHVVARDKYIANTHVATALGFVLSALLAIVVHGFGLQSRILGYALLLASTLMFVGAIFMYLRRRNPPARLSKGPWMRLPKSLMAFSVSFFLVTLPVAGILPADFGGWLLAALLSVGRVVGRVRNVLRHDLGRADETRLRRCPAPGLAPPRRTLWRWPLHRVETVGPER